jgi:hypothetical protein
MGTYKVQALIFTPPKTFDLIEIGIEFKLVIEAREVHTKKASSSILVILDGSVIERNP